MGTPEDRLLRASKAARDLLTRIGTGTHYGPTADLTVARELSAAIRAYEREHVVQGCIWCGRPSHAAYWPYCSTECAVQASTERD